MAQVTIAFDAWKDGKVASTRHEIPVAFAKKIDFKLVDVSPGIRKELIHPNRTALSIVGIQFSTDGKRIIAGDSPGSVVAVWDVETGKRTSTIETGHGNRGMSRYFFITPDWKTLFVNRPGQRKNERIEKDGKQFVKWNYNGAIHSWDLASGKPLRTYQHDPPRYVHVMTLSPDGTRFFTSEWLPGIQSDVRDNAATIWDVKTGTPTDLGSGIDSYCTFSPDGKFLASARTTKDGHATELRLLDAGTMKERLTIPVKENRAWAAISKFSSDSKYMFVAYQIFEKANDWKNFQYRFEVLTTADAKKVAFFTTNNEGLESYFSPDGNILALKVWQSKEPKLRLFDISTNRVTHTIPLGQQGKDERLVVHDPAFSPDGKWLAIAAQVISGTRPDGIDVHDLPQPRIHLIDVAAGAIRQTLVAPQGYNRSLCFSPDGRTLAVGGHGRVLLWDVSQLSK